MGAGITQVAALAGHPVTLFDSSTEAASKGRSMIRRDLEKLVSSSRLTREEAEAANQRIEIVGDITALRPASLVIEAIVEEVSAKQALFHSLEEVVEDSCILATNTSSISISRLASVLKRPERFLGMHFFNPAPRMALVEVVNGFATSPETSRAISEIARSWGKQPVSTKSTPGFIVNRVARPFYGEALRLLTESSIDPQTLDTIVRECGGFRMGPCELMDLIGNDINLAVTKSIWEAFYFDPRFSPSPLQQEMVDSRQFGRKTGRGFYAYGGENTERRASNEPPHSPPARIELRSDSTIASALRARLPTSIEVNELKGDSDEPALRVGATELFSTDGRTAAERSFVRAVPDLVLFDLCLDFEASPRITLTRSPACSLSAYREVGGLFQSSGYQVTAIDDTAGMIVMRIVAMLANEASEATGQKVCSEADVDLAMQLGTGYPLGPLAWSRRIGYQTLYTVLKNLGLHFGEDRYRVSPKIARNFWGHGF